MCVQLFENSGNSGIVRRVIVAHENTELFGSDFVFVDDV